METIPATSYRCAESRRFMTGLVLLPRAPAGRRAQALVLVATALVSAELLAQVAPPLPNRPDSVRFAAIGDNGTGERPQVEVAQQMVKAHATFPFDLVIMLGDNMYGGQSPA